LILLSVPLMELDPTFLKRLRLTALGAPSGAWSLAPRSLPSLSAINIANRFRYFRRRIRATLTSWLPDAASFERISSSICFGRRI